MNSSKCSISTIQNSFCLICLNRFYPLLRVRLSDCVDMMKSININMLGHLNNTYLPLKEKKKKKKLKQIPNLSFRSPFPHFFFLHAVFSALLLEPCLFTHSLYLRNIHPSFSLQLRYPLLPSFCQAQREPSHPRASISNNTVLHTHLMPI